MVVTLFSQKYEFKINILISLIMRTPLKKLVFGPLGYN